MKNKTHFQGSKMNTQIKVDSRTTVIDSEKAKEVVKAIRKPVNGTSSALRYMEQETEYVHQVSTWCKSSTGKLEYFKRNCSMKRITPLEIIASVRETKTYLKISWIAEGIIEGKRCFAEITAGAIWEKDWYAWDDCDSGGQKAPHAKIFISEADI